MNDIEETIIAVLERHQGYEQRISRGRLLAAINNQVKELVSDRRMRLVIEDLRANHPRGAFICSTTSGGYWMAENIDELRMHLKQDQNRAVKTLKRISQQRLRAGLGLTQAPLPMPAEGGRYAAQ